MRNERGLSTGVQGLLHFAYRLFRAGGAVRVLRIFLYSVQPHGGSASLTGVFANVFSIVLLLVLPILTMRLFSDEKRQRTDQALLTAPVSLTSIVLGKFLPPC